MESLALYAIKNTLPPAHPDRDIYILWRVVILILKALTRFLFKAPRGKCRENKQSSSELVSTRYRTYDQWRIPPCVHDDRRRPLTGAMSLSIKKKKKNPDRYILFTIFLFDLLGCARKFHSGWLSRLSNGVRGGRVNSVLPPCCSLRVNSENPR